MMLKHTEKHTSEEPSLKPATKPRVRRGAWPFVTFMQVEHEGRIFTWHARHHRKWLTHEDHESKKPVVPPWQTRRYNGAVGVLFAIGALLFLTGSMLTLFADRLDLSSTQIAPIFF